MEVSGGVASTLSLESHPLMMLTSRGHRCLVRTDDQSWTIFLRGGSPVVHERFGVIIVSLPTGKSYGLYPAVTGICGSTCPMDKQVANLPAATGVVMTIQNV